MTTQTVETLVHQAEKLPPVEFKQFVSRVLAIRARKQEPGLSAQESDLLLTINLAIPEATQQRYLVLSQKRDAETLTEDEYQELLALSDQLEAFNTKRISALAELAKIRQTTLLDLMQTLGIQSPLYN
jgi:hypothetical protein